MSRLCSFGAHKPEYLGWGSLSGGETFLKAAPSIRATVTGAFVPASGGISVEKILRRKKKPNPNCTKPSPQGLFRKWR